MISAAMYLKDIRADTRKKPLIKELKEYYSVKSAWGLGHIRVKFCKNECDFCLLKHCEITGYYRDYYDMTKQSVYLGDGYVNAKSRMAHVKSFL